MANIKSAKKRILITERNRQRNVNMRSSVKTAIRRVNEAIESFKASKDAAPVQQAVSKTFSLIDRAILKGIYHKNTGARYKSRITKRVEVALKAV